MKYVMDPCYRAIAPPVPPGAFAVDLGSGLGMLPVLLGVLGDGRRALGVEWDKAKVDCGVHARRTRPTSQVVEGDARSVDPAACDVITLVDMLHYYDDDAQRAMFAALPRSAAAGRPAARPRRQSGARGGARFTRAIESGRHRLGWNRGPQVRFRRVAELRADLEAARLQRPHRRGRSARTHRGNVLLVCEAA